MTTQRSPAPAVLCLLLLVSLACRVNRAPLKPAPPIGPDSCSHHALVTFRAAAEDSDGDWVRVYFDWGDGSLSDWTNWLTCDSPFLQEHAWHDPGTYQVRVRARDIHGTESEWSDPAVIDVDNKAPDFALPSVVGDTVRLRPRLISGPVYVIWWDLPCVNSIAEIDVCQPIYDSLSPYGFTLLAVSVDNAADSLRVRKFVASKGWRCPVLLDAGQVSKKSYGVVIKPTGTLIGMDTTIVYTHIGYKKGDEDSIKSEILKWMPPRALSPRTEWGRRSSALLRVHHSAQLTRLPCHPHQHSRL